MKPLEEMSFNERLAIAGIKQIYGSKTDLGRPDVTLVFNGKKYPRPDVMKIEETCKREFGVTI